MQASRITINARKDKAAQIQVPSNLTAGTIPVHWKICPRFQSRPTVFSSATATILQICLLESPAGVKRHPKSIPTLLKLQVISLRFVRQHMSIEQDLKNYERFAVEDDIHNML